MSQPVLLSPFPFHTVILTVVIFCQNGGNPRGVEPGTGGGDGEVGGEAGESEHPSYLSMEGEFDVTLVSQVKNNICLLFQPFQLL